MRARGRASARPQVCPHGRPRVCMSARLPARTSARADATPPLPPFRHDEQLISRRCIHRPAFARACARANACERAGSHMKMCAGVCEVAYMKLHVVTLALACTCVRPRVRPPAGMPARLRACVYVGARARPHVCPRRCHTSYRHCLTSRRRVHQSAHGSLHTYIYIYIYMRMCVTCPAALLSATGGASALSSCTVCIGSHINSTILASMTAGVKLLQSGCRNSNSLVQVGSARM